MTTRSARRLKRRAASPLFVAAGLLMALLPFVADPAVAGPSLRAAHGGATVNAPGAGERRDRDRQPDERPGQPDGVGVLGRLPAQLGDPAENSGDSLDVNTGNPVRVYQCRGADPAELERLLRLARASAVSTRRRHRRTRPCRPFTYPGQTDAYDATPDGPANWQDNVTGADGTGQVTLQVFTKRESAGLGCDSDRPARSWSCPTTAAPRAPPRT